MLNSFLLKKVTVFLTPLLIFILWQIWFVHPLAVIEVGLISLFLISWSVWHLTWRQVGLGQLQRDIHRQEAWRFSLMPGIFTLVMYLFLLMVESFWWRRLLALTVAVLLLIILQNIFDRFCRSANYPTSSFESISGNINSVSLFILAVVFYGWAIFLDTPVWLLAIFLLLAGTLLTYQLMWISGLSLGRSWLYLLLINLVTLEIFWVLFFLPNTFYIKAFVVTVVYYLAINLSRNQLLGLLNLSMIKRYLLVGSLVLGLVLITAQWL